MINDITLGQFFPGNSFLHKLDPRMKLILVILFIVIVFMAKSIPAAALLFLISILLAPIGQIGVGLLLKSLKPLRLVLILTAVINLFWTTGDGDPLLKLGPIHVYMEGIWYAIFICLRITSLLIGTTILLSYTTSPIALTDSIEQLLSPLKKIKIPVHDFAMIMTIALRFIPTLIEETNKIMNAQRARGTDFSSGSLLKRVKALIPIFVPLFVSSMNRADELAVAMECRCYHGDEGRTHMNTLRYGVRDLIALLVMIGIGVGIFFTSKVTFGIKF